MALGGVVPTRCDLRRLRKAAEQAKAAEVAKKAEALRVQRSKAVEEERLTIARMLQEPPSVLIAATGSLFTPGVRFIREPISEAEPHREPINFGKQDRRPRYQGHGYGLKARPAYRP
jgi:hypothetical protein